MSRREINYFQNIDPHKIAETLKTKLFTVKDNQPVLLYIASGKELSGSSTVKYGHISFDSTIRNPEDFNIRKASFLRKYGISDDGKPRNKDFILQNGITVLRKNIVHVLLDNSENSTEDLPENTWVTITNKGIQVSSVVYPEQLPSFFKRK